MYLVEFCGLPGTGKSTACLYLERSLRAKGYRVENIQKIPLAFGSIKRRMLKVQVRFNGRCRKLLKTGKKIISTNYTDEKAYWIERIIQTVYYAERAERKGIQIAACDEGCMQFVTSICHGEEMPSELEFFVSDIVRELYSKNQFVLVYCDVSHDEIAKRIITRNRPGDRFLAADVESIKKKLLLKEINLKKCISHLSKESIINLDLTSIETSRAQMDIIAEDICKCINRGKNGETENKD